jgi:hypothetical protein
VRAGCSINVREACLGTEGWPLAQWRRVGEEAEKNNVNKPFTQDVWYEMGLIA